MPLFNKKTAKISNPIPQYDNNNSSNTKDKNGPNGMNGSNGGVIPQTPAQQQQESNVTKPQLVFHCQLAHGSPTGLIAGFSSVKELYSKIAECYDFPVEEVIEISIILQFFLIKLFERHALTLTSHVTCTVHTE